MPLNKINKLFIRLARTQLKRQVGRRNKSMSFKYRYKKFTPVWVSLEIINAVTGEKTTAKANDASAGKLKKWLKMRNLRASFDEMVIKKNSSWLSFTDSDWKNFPVIVKVGTYKSPYVIDHVGEMFQIKTRKIRTVFLRTVGNIDYITLIDEKRQLINSKKKGKK